MTHPSATALARDAHDAHDREVCLAHLKRGSKSFAFAGRLMPSGAGEDATALYAFCRVADDLIDDGCAPLGAYEALCRRLDALHGASLEGYEAIVNLPHPEDRALARTMRKHDLPRTPIDALLEGFLWDAQGRQYETLEDTLAYAARVAGSVGLCMAWIMGQRQASVLARATDLGMAMQLTNIARDVGEDGLRQRVYLPRQALATAGIDARAVIEGATSDEGVMPQTTLLAIERVVHGILGEADVLYRRGRSGINHLPRRCQLAIDAAACIYRDIGANIINHRPYTLGGRAMVPWWRKAMILMRCVFFGHERRGSHALRTARPLPAAQFLLEPLL